MTFALDQTVYNDLFTQLVDQGVSLGYLKGIVKTLDGESFLSQSFVRDEIKQYVSLKGIPEMFPKKKRIMTLYGTLFYAFREKLCTAIVWYAKCGA